MAIKFNADEIFQMAEQIERNGAEFYRKAAKNNQDFSDKLLQLAKMEDGHLKTFQEMHKTLSDTETESDVFDPENEASLYLQTLAGGHVFDVKKKPSDILKGKESISQILEIAIGLEKESIIFYLGMKDMVSQTTGKEKIDFIIKEEMKHVKLLQKE